VTHDDERAHMVRTQLEARGIADARVLAAMRRVPREAFVPDALEPHAYEDGPLPIGYDQTISQPYIVGLMSELAALDPGTRVLEVGTGCGYQAAVLAELVREVYTIEIVASLARRAEATLRRLGYGGVRVEVGDGSRGWPAAAPFDAIVVTAAPERVPASLRDQLGPAGRLVIPVGGDEQVLQVHRRVGDGFEVTDVAPVRFVRMTGEALHGRS
jgi:protein-L-isoaspartate(D-aspartate) O-methyltransferase